MKPQNFATLALLAAGSLALALVAYSASAPWAPARPSGAKLFPTFETDAQRLAKIEVMQADQSLTVERTGDRWLVKESNGFPANPEKIRSFLKSLSEAHLVEAKTRNPQHHDILEVEDPKAKTANSHLVRLSDASGALLAEVVVGKQRVDAFGSNKAGSYVRRPEEEQAWLADQVISAGLKLSDWTRDRIYELRPERIKHITIAAEGAKPYDIERDENGRNFKLVGIPEGMKLRYVNSADDAADLLSSMKLGDVRKTPEGGPKGTPAGQASFETDTGIKIQISVLKDGEDLWANVSATGTGEGEKEAADIAAVTTGWEFKMPQPQHERLFNTFDDLIEKIGAGDAEQVPDGPPAPPQ